MNLLMKVFYRLNKKKMIRDIRCLETEIEMIKYKEKERYRGNKMNHRNLFSHAFNLKNKYARLCEERNRLRSIATDAGINY